MPIIRPQTTGSPGPPRAVRSGPYGPSGPSASIPLQRWGEAESDHDTFNFLVYGSNGSGKTSFWGTWPQPIGVLLCSNIDDTDELRSLDRSKFQDPDGGLFPVKVRSEADIRTIVQRQKTENLFKTLVLDHCTGLQDMNLRDVLGLTEIPINKDWGMARQQDYGEVAKRTKTCLRALLELRCHTIIVCQEKILEKQDEEEVTSSLVCPDLIPSISRWLCSVVGYGVQTVKRTREVLVETTHTLPTKKTTTVTTRKKVPGKADYFLRLEGGDDYWTKFRIPSEIGEQKPELIKNPTFAMVRDLIYGKLPDQTLIETVKR